LTAGVARLPRAKLAVRLCFRMETSLRVNNATGQRKQHLLQHFPWVFVIFPT
jgi:hypothetical protein